MSFDLSESGRALAGQLRPSFKYGLAVDSYTMKASSTVEYTATPLCRDAHYFQILSWSSAFWLLLFLPSSCSTCLPMHLTRWKFQCIALDTFKKMICDTRNSSLCWNFGETHSQESFLPTEDQLQYITVRLSEQTGIWLHQARGDRPFTGLFLFNEFVNFVPHDVYQQLNHFCSILWAIEVRCIWAKIGQ